MERCAGSSGNVDYVRRGIKSKMCLKKYAYNIRASSAKRNIEGVIYVFAWVVIIILGVYGYVNVEIKAESLDWEPADVAMVLSKPALNYKSTRFAQTGVLENPYAAYPYYIENNFERYEAYHAQFPVLNLSDVVWHVNASLDVGFYSEVSEIKSQNPLLVNKFNRLPEDFIPNQLSEVKYGHLVTPETMEAFNLMKKSAMAKGYIIDVVSGYRSYEEQRRLYESAVKEYGQSYADMHTARAGFSEHQTGRAIDIAGCSEPLRSNFGETPEYEWVTKNCENYGFIIRYTNDAPHITGYMTEPWHITFVGRGIALDMKKKGIKSLEEYAAKNPEILNDDSFNAVSTTENENLPAVSL